MTNEEMYRVVGMQIILGVDYYECQHCIFCSSIYLSDFTAKDNYTRVECRKEVFLKENKCKLFKERTFELAEYYPITICVDRDKF